jgi:thioredoxin 1
MTDKILKFQASWCAPCKALSKALEGVDLGVPVEEVDIDEDMDTAVSYGIRSVPTLVYVRDGSAVTKTTGSKTVDEIRDWIDTI